ncbi:MAG: hypothetical protein CME64_03280 [Halobacteriovoraceae bacterium]|nr:hypothetical protein [Halobacteriovoraceae bacterium]|tara:strand:+ start:74197 stop:75033 length:837 start_codon:yes stop_codon:yes gene_type:complete
MKELFILIDSATNGLHPDDNGLLEALAKHGIKGVPVVWEEFTPPTNSKILIRTPWDYALKREKFLRLLDLIEQSNSELINSVETVRWNMDKSYMLELKDQGVSIVPTKVVRKARIDPSISNDIGYPLVVKPLVGAGGKDTFLIHSEDEISKANPLADRDILVQPYKESVNSVGEYSYLFFDGEFSHCILKKAKDDEFRVQEEHGGTVHKHSPSKEHLDIAIKAFERLNNNYCYARLDFVEDGNDLLLMELEVIEPQLFFSWAPEAIERLATSVAKRIS